MSYCLFLDDVREPPDSKWILVRSYDEAVAHVLQFGMMNEISLDHDLGEANGVVLKNGYDFAKWLIEQDMDGNLLPNDFQYTSHSANPVGRDNIINLLSNYMKNR